LLSVPGHIFGFEEHIIGHDFHDEYNLLRLPFLVIMFLPWRIVPGEDFH
jgi:hypothetical protein